MIETLIEQIRVRLANAQYSSESAVREAVILPILSCLGWDTLDPTIVCREFPLGSRRVDYALATPPGTNKQIFIEVKAIGQSTGGDRQLFEYAFHEGIPFAILTDGREWSFYLPGGQGSYDDRRVQRLDMVERPIDEVVEVLQKYLDYKRVKSGVALDCARTDYQSISKRKTAAQTIGSAWRELISEPDSLLIDLISEKVESICGFRPGPEDIEAFLDKASNKTGPKSIENVSGASNDVKVTPVSEKHISYEIFGQTKKSDNAIGALIDILRTLASRNPFFLEKLSNKVRTKKRNHLSPNREDVYPGKPELTEYTIQVVPGWWLGTNIANREKMKIIKMACDVEKLVIGKDVSIQLPNAK